MATYHHGYQTTGNQSQQKTQQEYMYTDLPDNPQAFSDDNVG